MTLTPGLYGHARFRGADACRADRPGSRHRRASIPSRRAPKDAAWRWSQAPVHKFARPHGIDVRTPVSLKDAEEQAAFAALESGCRDRGGLWPAAAKADSRCAAAGLFQSAWLAAAALARRRARSSARSWRAIAETGVMVMRMEEGLDTGPVLMAERVPIGRKTYGELHDELSRLGADLMVRALGALERGSDRGAAAGRPRRHLRQENLERRSPHRLVQNRRARSIA